MENSRRSGRIAKEVPILLLGTDPTGTVFSEQTKTVVLSRHGAGIVSKHRFAPDEVLTLRLMDSSREAEVRLVGQIGGAPDRYVYGVAFVDPRLDFWQIEFPPADSFQPDDRRLTLECTLCHERQEVQPRDIEADVYSVNQSILRYCLRCRTVTVWKQAETSSPSRARIAEPCLSPPSRTSPAPSSVQYSPVLPTALLQTAESVGEPVAVAATEKYEASLVNAPATSSLPASAAPGRRVNRRRDVRTRVSFSACVRYRLESDDIVECENVSKGGLCFRSRRRYDEGALIEVAAPYSPGSPVIFVPAHIKHVQRVPGGEFFRYGVAYVKSSPSAQQKSF
jgi:hypothetical protein